MRRLFLLSVFVAVSGMLDAQKKAPENWFNLDPKKDKVYGVSTEKTYNTLLKGKIPQTVVVAVIDGGTDVMHEDLREVVWSNPGEIAGNGIDDDNNGYVDDIHGWNFIGGKDGKNVNQDNLELTRLYRHYQNIFGARSEAQIKPDEQADYARWKKVKATFEEKSEGEKAVYQQIEPLCDFIANVKNSSADGKFTPEAFELYSPVTNMDINIKNRLTSKMKEDPAAFENIRQLDGACAHYGTSVKYQLNPDFDPRSIVGDNYEDGNERVYGNNDVIGPGAEHGTHVAGIIGAVRDNNLGMKGVSNSVRIMVLRVVPDGDERDKDVANAIRYAADNGAKVINMSFGKSWSWNKTLVDEAVAYAASKDVLLVHAAGNDNQNNDTSNNFPTDISEKTGTVITPNWLEVGASSWRTKKQLTAEFSNYGKKNVDLFAPGVDIYSTYPGSTYENNDGTSMASPVAAGVACMIRSYYPSLSAAQVKDYMMRSVNVYKKKVWIPGSHTSTKLSNISVTGGVVNAYNAIKVIQKENK